MVAPIRLSLIVLAVGVPAFAATAPEPGERERIEAREYERRQEWDRACESYLRLLADDRQQPEIRDRLALCLRHLHQAGRHGDPLYRTYVAALPLSQALALYSETLATLQRNYADPAQVGLEKLFRHGLEELSFALGDPIFRREQLGSLEPDAVATVRDRLIREWSARPITELRDARQSVRDLAWETQQLTGVNPSAIVLEFACGACHALDEYSLFVAPGRPAYDAASLNHDLAAFGLTLISRGGSLSIDRVAPGSWGAGEGLGPGDRVTQVGKAPLDRLSLEAALEIIRGERSAVTELTIVSGTGEPRKLTLPETIPSVFDAVMERDGIGYVRIASFQKTTPQEFDSALLRLRSEGLRVLVLDLRGNPGGSFPAAVQVAERFLNQGIIVSTQGQLRGLTKTFTAQPGAALTDVPVAVLVDGDTASAAEVLAGALKDHQRAVLVGQPTFGKDTVQRLLQLSEGAAIRLTLARFLLPAGKPFAGIGITPHVYESRRESMRDYQFEAAMEQAARMLAMR